MADMRHGAIEDSPAELLPRHGGGHDDLRRQFQDLGLKPYETRVLLALLAVGQANSVQLAHRSGVPRTSIYEVMRGLTERAMAQPTRTYGSAAWTTPGWNAVVDLLDAAEDARQRMHEQTMRDLRRAFTEESAPPASALPSARDAVGADLT